MHFYVLFVESMCLKLNSAIGVNWSSIIKKKKKKKIHSVATLCTQSRDAIDRFSINSSFQLRIGGVQLVRF
jgi:hypothetical protein